MTKPNELFIGAVVNYFTAEGDEMPQIANAKTLEWIEQTPEQFNLVHSPIPITPEILTDWCGWYDINYSESITIIQNGDFIFKKMSKLGFSYIIFRGEKLEHIKHLHQLQSLYQLITGEEMPIKIPEE